MKSLQSIQKTPYENILNVLNHLGIITPSESINYLNVMYYFQAMGQIIQDDVRYITNPQFKRLYLMSPSELTNEALRVNLDPNQDKIDLIKAILDFSILFNLPLELQYNVLSKLEYRDILRFCQVNKTLKEQCSRGILWSDIARQRGYIKNNDEFGDSTKWPQGKAAQRYLQLMDEKDQNPEPGALRYLVIPDDELNELFNSLLGVLRTKDTKGAIKILDGRGGNQLVNYQDQYGETALIRASLRGYLDIVKLLLDRGAKIDLQDKYGNTALMYASINGHLEVARLLLDRGAKIDYQNEYGKTALMHASIHGHLEVVKLLLSRGAKIDRQDKNGETALMWATGERHLEVVRLLLERGAKIDLQDKYEQTALILASAFGHLDVVRLLLDSGANVNHQNKDGETALMRALAKGHREVVRLLSARGG